MKRGEHNAHLVFLYTVLYSSGMKEQAQLPFGGQRGTRPATLAACPSCSDVLGTHYPQCSACYDAIERIWQADWQALLTHEQIEQGSADETLLAQIVVAKLEQHPWTVVDIAMTHLHCATCGSELGGGFNDCGECAMAFGNLWWYDIAASQQGNMTGNEHALRVGQWVLRYPHRNRVHAVTA